MREISPATTNRPATEVPKSHTRPRPARSQRSYRIMTCWLPEK